MTLSRFGSSTWHARKRIKWVMILVKLIRTNNTKQQKRLKLGCLNLKSNNFKHLVSMFKTSLVIDHNHLVKVKLNHVLLTLLQCAMVIMSVICQMSGGPFQALFYHISWWESNGDALALLVEHPFYLQIEVFCIKNELILDEQLALRDLLAGCWFGPEKPPEGMLI